MNWFYRFRQFWLALTAKPEAEDLAWAQAILSQELFTCFAQLQPGEQVHALAVARQMQAGGYVQPEALAAALLHDVGKAQVPLWVWERVLIVLGRQYWPEKAVVWGQGQARGWRRAFVVAAQHPAWGAALVQSAGAAPLVVWLVAHHQDGSMPEVDASEQELLAALQAADEDH